MEWWREAREAFGPLMPAGRERATRERERKREGAREAGRQVLFI